MGNENNNGDEIFVYTDENGKEIYVDKDGNELVFEEDPMGTSVLPTEEIRMEDEYELEEPVYESDSENYGEEAKEASFDEEDEDGVLSKLSSKMLIVLGAVIAVIAIGVGIFLISQKSSAAEAADVDFSNVGTNVVELGYIGGDNIEAITSTRGQMLDDLNEAVSNYDYDEADEETGITTVSVTLTTILKDLKIKFVKPNGKLIANVPFQVEVTDPNGKTSTWTDTDKDGIIYETDLTGGTYKVKLIALSGYDTMYDFSTETTQSLAVKTQLDYQKVDVKNEIKASTQVAATEDAAENDTVEESKLTDTVSWVMSEKIASGTGYTAIDKNNITNPITVLTKQYEASLLRFKRLSGQVNVEEEETVSGDEISTTHEHHYVWDNNVGNGSHTLVCDSATGECTAKTITQDCTYNESNVCTVCGYKKIIEGKIEFSGTTSVALNAETSITAAVSPTMSGLSYVWKSADTSIATVTPETGSNTVTVKGLSSGKSTTISCTAYDGTTQVAFNTVSLTVTSQTISLDTTGKKAIYYGSTTDNTNTAIVKATTYGGKTNNVTWSVSKDGIIDLNETETDKSGTSVCKITSKSTGTVTLTATSDDDKTVMASVTIIVAAHPNSDTTTKLVDNDGNQIYVYNSSTKKYVEATYADYYSGTTLYKASEVTYTYTGWWTIDGKTYFFDSNGKKVTGDQVILGAKYSFDSNGVLKSGTGTFGIDVSSWNGTIDWSKVAKSGVNFAIIRCGFRGTTVGGLVEDSKFETNLKNAKAAGVKVGIYFFSQAISEAEAVEEASMCLTVLDGASLNYPIFLDMENATNGRANSLTKDQRTAIAKAFCKTITNAGYKAGIYANKTWLTSYINTSELTSYTIWLAQYASSPTYTSTRYDVWQYQDTGSISGISGNVDLDLSYLGY